MHTATLLLHRSMGSARPEDYIKWAFKQLDEGLDSPSLRILAGLNPKLESEDVEPYFQKTCQELNIELQPLTAEPREMAWLVKRTYELGEITPAVALQMMADLYQRSQYLDPLLAIWYNIVEELEMKGTGHEGCFYPPEALESLEEALDREWSLFVRASRLDLLQDFDRFIRCEECGHIGNALLKRKTFWSRIVAVLPWVRRKPPMYSTCPSCCSHDYRTMADPNIRDIYFQQLESKVMPTAES